MIAAAGCKPECKSPRSLGGSVTQSLYVYVDDVDAHHAQSTGARNFSEPEDQFYGDRIYTVADLEGHRWTFGQHIRDVAPEDMHPPE